jgi:hypothetical protein
VSKDEKQVAKPSREASQKNEILIPQFAIQLELLSFFPEKHEAARIQTESQIAVARKNERMGSRAYATCFAG